MSRSSGYQLTKMVIIFFPNRMLGMCSNVYTVRGWWSGVRGIFEIKENLEVCFCYHARPELIQYVAEVKNTCTRALCRVLEG